MTWTNKQLGLCLNLTPQRIGQLVKAGVLPHPSPRGHDPFVSIPRYLAFLQEQLAPQSLRDAQVAKLEIDTAFKKLMLEERRGLLVDKFRWNNLMWTCHRAIRDQIQNIGIRVAALVMSAPTVVAAAAVIDTELNQVLTAAGKAVAQLTSEAEEDYDHATHSAQGNKASTAHPNGTAEASVRD